MTTSHAAPFTGYRQAVCTARDHGHDGALVFSDLTGSDPCPTLPVVKEAGL